MLQPQCYNTSDGIKLLYTQTVCTEEKSIPLFMVLIAMLFIYIPLVYDDSMLVKLVVVAMVLT